MSVNRGGWEFKHLPLGDEGHSQRLEGLCQAGMMGGCGGRGWGRDSKQREQPGHRHGGEQMLENLRVPSVG